MENKLFLKLHDYKSWEIKSPDDYDWDRVIIDSHGYVIMDNGSRYDSPEDLYKEERVRWNKLKKQNFIHIEIGRWTITNDGIETKKENGAPYSFTKKDIWSFQNRQDFYLYDLPIHVSSKGWISNTDLLDFNSAFLVCQELFENDKPSDFPKVSWSETLRRQYKRFQKSLDINSFNSRKQFEDKQAYMKSLSFEEQFKILKVNLDKEPDNSKEIFGDQLSREA